MKNFYFSFVFILLLLAFQTAGGQIKPVESSEQKPKTDVRAENAKKQFEEMLEVVIRKGNYEKIADYAHPKTFEITGGREKFIETMTKAYKSVEGYFKLITWTIGEPQNLTEIDKELFVVLPRTLDGTSPQDVRIVQKSSIVGISSDNGKTWKFVNGTAFDKFFPSLAGKIQIPKEQTFINGIEQ